MSKPVLWLRCEKKEFERRSALTPTTAKKLIDAGFDIYVERDEQRIFDDAEFEAVGAKLVENNSWPQAPKDTPIIGLKELPVSTDPLPHTHIQFAHCYKNQADWSKVLARFHNGGGTLYDLEFLNDDSAGALAFAANKKGEKLGMLNPYPNETAMVEDVQSKLGKDVTSLKALVMGALGRCGKGAVDLLRKIGLQEDNILKWDLPETAKGGPFSEILDVDYLPKFQSFVTRETIEAAGQQRQLSVVVDVSCDTTNPFNPIPIYSVNTTFSDPTVPMKLSSDLLPSLLQFPKRQEARVWTDAEKLFKIKAEGL
ncbi:hypothetical protein DL96DRAFT_1573862 [Flagelloscypha sp. PMI_526]|nr:hypothetical protein DL96DRAFT_1573862 [Flagelloscypha sp. PMI_526]